MYVTPPNQKSHIRLSEISLKSTFRNWKRIHPTVQQFRKKIAIFATIKKIKPFMNTKFQIITSFRLELEESYIRLSLIPKATCPTRFFSFTLLLCIGALLHISIHHV